VCSLPGTMYQMRSLARETRPALIAVGPIGQLHSRFSRLTHTETVSIWDTRIE